MGVDILVLGTLVKGTCCCMRSCFPSRQLGLGRSTRSICSSQRSSVCTCASSESATLWRGSLSRQESLVGCGGGTMKLTPIWLRLACSNRYLPSNRYSLTYIHDMSSGEELDAFVDLENVGRESSELLFFRVGGFSSLFEQ